jgi:hypothetical protein
MPVSIRTGRFRFAEVVCGALVLEVEHFVMGGCSQWRKADRYDIRDLFDVPIVEEVECE